jgi:hypothetical protein
MDGFYFMENPSNLWMMTGDFGGTPMTKRKAPVVFLWLPVQVEFDGLGFGNWVAPGGRMMIPANHLQMALIHLGFQWFPRFSQCHEHHEHHEHLAYFVFGLQWPHVVSA